MDAFTGEIRAVSFGYAPPDWLLCEGQVLQVIQYQALASILGNKFGGDGRTTFQLPNLSGRVVAHQQTAPPNPARAYGSTYGSDQVTLLPLQLPAHNHSITTAVCDPLSENPVPSATEYLGHSTMPKASTYAPDGPSRSPFASTAVDSQGAGQAHENRQPYLVLNYIICANGVYPVRS